MSIEVLAALPLPSPESWKAIKTATICTLVVVSIATKRPALCTVLLGVAAFVSPLVYGLDVRGAIFSSILMLLLGAPFFWLLNYFKCWSFLWWTTAIIGVTLLSS
jgi:hypothetical protein